MYELKFSQHELHLYLQREKLSQMLIQTYQAIFIYYFALKLSKLSKRTNFLSIKFKNILSINISAVPDFIKRYILRS